MQLAQWQKDKILELRRQYLVALGHILQERQEVETGLQVCSTPGLIRLGEMYGRNYFFGKLLQGKGTNCGPHMRCHPFVRSWGGRHPLWLLPSPVECAAMKHCQALQWQPAVFAVHDRVCMLLPLHRSLSRRQSGIAACAGCRCGHCTITFNSAAAAERGAGRRECEQRDSSAHSAAQPCAASWSPVAAHLPMHGLLFQGHLDRGEIAISYSPCCQALHGRVSDFIVL